jgi:hypothetical protein
VSAHLRIQLELSEFATAVTRNAGHVPPAVREALHGGSEAYHDTWRALIAEGYSAGELRPGLDPTIARMLAIGALNWAVEWWTPGRPVDDLIHVATAMVGSALGSPPPRASPR